MQGYLYSVFSICAIFIHLIINFDLIIGRRTAIVRGTHYRGFLMGIFAYYITDAAWGILAGLGWTAALYVDTVLYFLALVAFVFMWSQFVVAYVGLGKWVARMLSAFGYALLAVNIVMLVINVFNNCFFYFDEQGTYLVGPIRYDAFAFLIAFNMLVTILVLVKALSIRGPVRGRIMMVFVNCLTMTVAIALQVVWPLTPFTALGCLIGSCFIHIFVIENERLAKHMKELEEALNRARTAEKSRSMFFSIVSHDIRTPLNAILGYSELLQYGIRNKTERDEALNSIRACGTTLLQLVNDVLDLAKMDTGKMELVPEPVRLDHLTDDVFASFRMAAAGKGVDLVNRTAGVPAVLLDAHRFRQILFNLVGNAVKFTDSGSITVAASYVGNDLEVSVSDTGCGIPSNMLTHILDPFVQVQDPSHSAYRAMGSGLGLSICRRLVELMGGELAVESEPGKGTKLTARIPGVATTEKDVGPVADPRLALTATRLPKSVLVVDDSPVNRSVLRAFLKKAGVESIGNAADGEEAIAALDSAVKAGRPYDFVFSDLWMPNMNGIEFIEKLRADNRFDKLPVFAVTADAEFQRDSRNKLFTGVLLKPLTYAKLVEVFARLK